MGPQLEDSKAGGPESTKGFNGARGSMSKEASWFLFKELLECPHSTVAGLPLSKQLKKPMRKLQCFSALVLEVTHHHSHLGGKQVPKSSHTH